MFANDALNTIVPDSPVPILDFTVQPTSELAGQQISPVVVRFTHRVNQRRILHTRAMLPSTFLAALLAIRWKAMRQRVL